jgi:hypothetical protein
LFWPLSLPPPLWSLVERKKKRLHPRLLRRPPLHPLPLLHRRLKPRLQVRLLHRPLRRPLRLLLPPPLPALKPRSKNFCFLDFIEKKSHPRVAFFLALNMRSRLTAQYLPGRRSSLWQSRLLEIFRNGFDDALCVG